jgi:AcrR family transcriptional regulator
MSWETGLRERKKAATRRALHEAAWGLAVKLGPDRVTVEAIADATGVSRRTFSNYFGSKEEALMYGDLQRFQRMVAIVHGRPADETPWTALSAAAEEFFRDTGDLDPDWVARGRLVRIHPSLVAAQVQTFAAVERELAAAVMLRLGADPGGIRAPLFAACFLSALRVALNVWLDSNASMPLLQLVRDTLATTGRGFAT